MSNSTEDIPHDSRSRDYFKDTAYDIKHAEALNDTLNIIHDLVEAQGDGFLYEQKDIQRKQIDRIMGLATQIIAKCQEYKDIHDHGI